VPLRRSYEVYRPFADESLRSLVAAGTEALRQYRLHSDGPARALLARQGSAREAALGEIVRRYFLTTVGDDAAFELGCRYLELGNITAADHLFERLSLYPDSNIASDDIAIRRAVAQSRLGRTDVASRLVETLGAGSEAIRPLLLADLEAQQSNANGRHTMASLFNTPSGLGAAGHLEPNWEFLPTWSLKGVKPSTNNQAIMSGMQQGRPMIFVRQAGGNYVQTSLQDKDIPDLSLSQLATNWRAAAWRPASQPVVAEGRIYLKSESRTVCCDAATGQVVWMGRPTQFPLDDWSRQLAQVAAHGVNLSYPTPTTTMGPQPKTMTEIMLFADRLHQGLIVGDGRVFAIEGELETPASKKQPVNTAPQRAAFVEVEAGRQQGRRNELACYGATTGKLQWTVSGAAIVAEGTTFLSAPLLLGKVLIVATGTESQLGIAALNVADGALVWKTTLSDLTARSAQTIPVGLTADDGCIYVANGAGTLFSIDRNGGALRWAVTYPRTRSGAIDRQAAAMGMAMGGGMAATGARVQVVLDENFIARQSGTIVVAPSDSDHVMAFNVTDGSLRWDSPLPPAVANGPPGYVLGTRDGRVYLGSSKWLWCVNLNGGRIVWDTPLEASCGRGILTSESLLVPQGRTIVQLDPASGKLLRTTEIETPNSEPVGNLLSDGRQLVVASAARLLAMKPAGAPKPEGAAP
jgi:outer membrane protein assembly factor BamB